MVGLRYQYHDIKSDNEFGIFYMDAEGKGGYHSEGSSYNAARLGTDYSDYFNGRGVSCDVNTGPLIVGGCHTYRYLANIQYAEGSERSMGIFDSRCPHAYPEERSNEGCTPRLCLLF